MGSTLHTSDTEGWTIERFLIPINFAPQILYNGVEDIRFTPGWAKPQSDDYWSYAFLWYLDGKPQIDANTIASNLKAYYTGLIRINTESSKVPDAQIVVTTRFDAVATGAGDASTYSGTITMLDFMQLKPITLNCIVHVKPCSASDKAVLFYELSPQPFTHKVWESLSQLWIGFSCLKTDAQK
ncbi:MAG TPA: hypothetical protein VM871_10300 [Flavisolibacter sp.]|nr:hypothetical protein [Flavisolibacter sp.]